MFCCDYVLDDLFGIDEITMYEGEWSEKTYAVAGEIIDGVSFFYKVIINGVIS
jgi:complement component 1 Q subcomponent-binding protein